jgi:putative copper resistance protein D
VWSIFNHRVAGWYVLLWGLTAFIAGLQWPRRTWWRFVPPMTLFALAQFLFFRNDPSTWPIGPVGFWASLQDAEHLQHRIFLLLLLLISIIELLRAANRLPSFLAKYWLAGMIALASGYLLFHAHGGLEMTQHIHDPAMGAPPAMQRMTASMSAIIRQHGWFSVLGFGIAAGKLLADTGRVKERWANMSWSACAILLGAYMTGYTE